MKNSNLICLILVSITLSLSCQQKNNVKTVPVKQEISIVNPEISLGVRGNCGMCKTTIEKAALSVDGVEEASWSTATKILDIKTKSSLDSITIKIHQAVADSGYDTELISAMEDSYSSLPGCCQYNREMVITNNN
jgi:copper chaperone CopZ